MGVLEPFVNWGLGLEMGVLELSRNRGWKWEFQISF